MLDSLEEILGQIRSAWRFSRQALAVAWGVAIVGWIGVLFVPPQYETNARVFVDTNSLLRPLLQGLAVPPNTINQVELVRRVLLSRPHLEEVIRKTDLRLRARNSRELEATIDDLTRLIQIKGEGRTAEGPEHAPPFYLISFRDRDAGISYAVVQSLLDSFLEESLGANRNSTQSAERFLTSQLTEYEQRLSESEKALAEFKRNNLGAMPDERGGYFARLQAEMVELDRLKSQLPVAVARRDELRGKLLGAPPTTGSNAPETTVLETSVDGPLANARQKLADLLLRFTENHPDVIALQETIKRLEEQRNAELAMLRQHSGALGGARGSTSLVAQNLQIALNQVEVEITGLQSQIADRSRRVDELRKTINSVPEVEAELARLTRDYTVTKSQYDALLQRRESARLSGQADQMDALKLRVIEAPVKSLEPASPKLGILITGVFVAALAAGAGLAFVMMRINPVFSRVRQLAAIAKYPVIGFIDRLQDPVAARARRRQYVAVCVGLALLLVCFLVVVTHAPRGQALALSIKQSIGTV